MLLSQLNGHGCSACLIPDLVFEVQHVSLPYTARDGSEITHFLDRTEGILKGHHLRAAYGRHMFSEPMIATLVARVHALTPHLEDFRLTLIGSSMFEISSEREESLARVQSEQLLSSISRFQKLASMSLRGVCLNVTSFSLLGRVRCEQLKYLTLRNFTSYSIRGEHRNLLKISDETFEDLIEVCPRLKELKIIGGTGLHNPVIMSKTLQTLDLDVVIKRSLTVHAPLLSFLSIPGVPSGADISAGTDFHTFTCREEGEYDHVRLSNPESLKDITVRGKWKREGLTRFLVDCRNVTRIHYSAECVSEDGQSQMDLLEILSHQTSVKRLWITFMSAFSDDGVDAPQPQHWQFQNLEYIRLPLTEIRKTRLCSCLIEAAPKLRVLNLSDACLSILQGLIFYKESLQKRLPQLSITLRGNR
jgi:hypothetical protein